MKTIIQDLTAGPFPHVAILKYDEPDDRLPCYVGFDIVQVSGETGKGWPEVGARLYAKGGCNSFEPTTDIHEAEVIVHGFVKFDGCTQFWIQDGAHYDHRDGYEGFLEAMRGVRKLAAEIMGNIVGEEYT